MGILRKRVLMVVMTLCVVLGLAAPAFAQTKTVGSKLIVTEPTKHTWTLTHPERSLTNGSSRQNGKVTYCYYVGPTKKVSNGWVKAKNTKYAWGTDYAHTTLIYKVTRDKTSAKARAKTGCAYKYTGLAATYRMYLKYRNGKIVAARWKLESTKRITEGNENRRTFTLYSNKKLSSKQVLNMFPYWRMVARDESIALGSETKADDKYLSTYCSYGVFVKYENYLYNKDGILEKTCEPEHHLG